MGLTFGPACRIGALMPEDEAPVAVAAAGGLGTLEDAAPGAVGTGGVHSRNFNRIWTHVIGLPFSVVSQSMPFSMHFVRSCVCFIDERPVRFAESFFFVGGRSIRRVSAQCFLRRSPESFGLKPCARSSAFICLRVMFETAGAT